MQVPLYLANLKSQAVQRFLFSVLAAKLSEQLGVFVTLLIGKDLMHICPPLYAGKFPVQPSAAVIHFPSFLTNPKSHCVQRVVESVGRM